jgi:hypothetical protein
MRLIPGWFKYMFAGMAVFFFFISAPILYANPLPFLYIEGIPLFASVVAWSLVGAAAGAFSYAAGAVVVGWAVNLIKYLYRTLVGILR